MKKLTLFLSLVLILMLAFCGFFYTGGTLRASVGRTDAPAASYPSEFELVRSALTDGSAPIIYSDEALGDIGEYTLVAVSVTLTNPGLFDAEWLNVQPEALPGDVAVYYLSGDGGDVRARGQGSVGLKFLTRAAADSPRRLSIQYYVYGISRTITVEL